MEMIDMTAPAAPGPMENELELHLNAEQILALNLTGDMEIGKELMIHAKACVVEVGMEDGRPKMELKVKAMGVMNHEERADGENRDAPHGTVSQGKIKSVMGYYS